MEEKNELQKYEWNSKSECIQKKIWQKKTHRKYESTNEKQQEQNMNNVARASSSNDSSWIFTNHKLQTKLKYTSSR